MYSLINQNIDLILPTLDRQYDIDMYISLMRRFHQNDVRNDAAFHEDYCRYWQLDPAMLEKRFCAAYFNLMEGLR